MIVSIYPIRSWNPSLEVLKKDGWQLESRSRDHVYARHPQVNDESSARSRLYRIGLLTSASLRIAFRRESARSSGPIS